MVANVRTYTWLLITNRAGWLTGSLTTVLWFVAEGLWGEPTISRLFFVLIGVTFIAASYRTWHEEYQANRSREARKRHVVQLRNFHREIGPLIDEPLPKGISLDDFNAYVEKIDTWVNNVATWIQRNMGEAACEEFLDRTGIQGAAVPRAVNSRHANVILSLTRFRSNLNQLIEQPETEPLWDVEDNFTLRDHNSQALSYAYYES
jgi:hypothetical protein